MPTDRMYCGSPAICATELHRSRIGGYLDWVRLAADIKAWGQALGFQQIGITDTDLSEAELHLQNWLAASCHGEMGYMARHGTRRSRPAELVPGTVRVISARMDYFPPNAIDAKQVLAKPSLGYISRYALGRDYHKVLRRRLDQLEKRITFAIGPIGLFGYRIFTDSAPVLEKALAEKAGLGWIGKHTNLIARKTGSWCFLGEIYTELPLPSDAPESSHCGRCTRCIEACPTRAITAPYQIDARRCISYLTIELRGSLPEELRPLLGNRIYGCDDCQLVCPWNGFARPTSESDFTPRHGLDAPRLALLMAWSEAEFLARTEGSAIRRIGYEQFLRNVAVALGNASPGDIEAIMALGRQVEHTSALVREHVAWALNRQDTIRIGL
ncbi:epoxyqueuosine reductase [Gammaproteobacteria bacterium]